MDSGKILASNAIITDAQKTEAEKHAKAKKMAFADAVVHLKFAPKEAVYSALAEAMGVPFIEISTYVISPECLKLISQESALRHHTIPIFHIQNTLTVAMEDPTNLAAIDRLRHESGKEIDPCLSSPLEIREALDHYYGTTGTISKLIASLDSEKQRRGQKETVVRPSAAPPEVTAADQPIVQLVNLIIEQAIDEGASDIHIEPDEEKLRIRFRIDGVLHAVPAPSKSYESAIISRLKVMAQMDIAETRAAQDGRMKVTIKEHPIDIRVSVIPTVHGENLVLRLLDTNKTTLLDLKQLGFTDDLQRRFEELIRRPFGMLLEAGPTGSGKTTTLYAALSTINSSERNIVTIEDPVEYKLPLIRQIQVNPKANLTFANGLRSIVRQDPDIIMVGEIRDAETAAVAIQAASTGHLVFSTIHTNNAVGAVSRLVEMNIEPFLISSSLIGVLAQRLVRRICAQCKEPADAPDRGLLAGLFENPDEALKKIKFFKGRGCYRCRGTGYKGRIAIFELLRVTEKMQELIGEKAPASLLLKEARSGGMKTLREDALEKVKEEITTIDEIVREV